ncbi:MAG: hypothetical protein ACI87W_001259 [Halieaceae bacterium]|jgi:uncharacterized protein YcgL (UPF0745 family)
MPLVLCEIFRSPKREGMYLYVPREEGLERVPEQLLDVFGTPVRAMTLRLTAEKKLARVDVKEVIAALQQQGYYLQMPPSSNPEAEEEALERENTLNATLKGKGELDRC